MNPAFSHEIFILPTIEENPIPRNTGMNPSPETIVKAGDETTSLGL